MMAQYSLGLSRETLVQIVQPSAVFLIVLLALLVTRRLVLRALYRRAAGAGSPAYLIPETLRLPSILWSLAAALHFALQVSEAPEIYTHRAAQVIVVFVVVSLCMVAAAVSVRMFALYGQRKGMVVAASGLARTLIRVLVFTCGAVFLLWFFGKQVTGVLAALGVGGLAFALALQDTLANFFAGIHILVEEPISVGNAIRLSEKEEGVVTDIGWRTTRVRTARNNVIVVPNTKITSGILTNYSLPEARVGLEVPVMAAHEADPDLVLRIALEEVRDTPGVLPDPAPNVLFVPGFLPTHLEFKAVFAVADFAQQGPVGSEVRLRILRRLRAEGVPLPRVEIR